jgi:CheY-like chemotaxis protein
LNLFLQDGDERRKMMPMPKQILIIDDEPYIREIIQVSLETVAGWQVLTASSGYEGIATAEVEPIDAILLDLMMPHMDGIATFQKLQENPKTRHLPVILLTAKLQMDDRLRYTQLGIKAALSKPFQPLELAREIAQVLGWEQA